ncbi:acyltransferase family protein [Mesorhizobium sp. B2-7-1]|uniref:acyltransferase family protein n=1 Tax=Mesorhizobium sp. B2-7-1 TaxID=2589909 RepID=UPI00112DDFD7|nr:acyltransferase family protein [Mesorhizobium sp. B2-7-1]TPJ52274.1 acyltransferase [Mesorhizobium sp. B2-7-1]
MERKVHFFTLDFLRIFSAMLVLLSHFSTYAARSASIVNGKGAAFGLLSVFAGLGSAGVGTLFVISGFAIAMSASREGGVSPAVRFVGIRAIRILPAMWISALIAFAARAFYGEDFQGLLMDFARSAVLSPKGPYIDGVVWSLVVQSFFYLLVAASILSRFRFSLYDLARLIGLCSSAYLLVLLALHLAPSTPETDRVLSILTRFPFKLLLLQHGVFFAAGMMFHIHHSKNSEPIREALMRPAILLFFFVAMCALEILLTMDSPGELRSVSVAIFLSFISVMMIGKNFERQVDAIFKDYKFIIGYLGRMSYSIYLNHYATGMVLVWWLFSLGMRPVSAFFVSVTGVLALSVIITWLEKKIQTAVDASFLRVVQHGAKSAAA